MKKPTVLILAIFLIGVLPVNAVGSSGARIEVEDAAIRAEHANLNPDNEETELSDCAQVRFAGLTIRADCICYYSQAQVLTASGACEFIADALSVNTEAEEIIPGYICETDGYYVIKGILSFDDDGKILINDGNNVIVMRKEALKDYLE